MFQKNNFNVPANFRIAGVFYVKRGNLIATSAYGSNRINVRCVGKDCIEQFNFFEQILDKAVNS